MRRILIIVTAISFVLPGRCSACLWDYDTLAMERQRFPGAQELIVGHFVRHSTAYYEWRISDRTSKAIEERSQLDFDDLAVAYDKLGQHDKAISTIRAKMDRWPDERRYESEANLGTFYIHSGRFPEGLQHIKRAIEINPDAHFGREIYQKLLVEYVIESRRPDRKLPLSDDDVSYGNTGFAAFVLAAQKTSAESQIAEIQAAAKGIMGMMRFGHHDSPILLEALGDLLLSVRPDADSKMLAARAYLKASYEVEDPAAVAAYRKKAERALKLQFERELSVIESDLKSEIERADRFFREISADERAWIDSGKNLDKEFGEKYYKAPPLYPVAKTGFLIKMGLAILFVSCGATIAIVTRQVRRHRDATAK
ncbi:MAG: hypothetical protein VX768_21185 [Planctomycetota bacterium]|nr:hypothetical protein [Planctomycetota bacterium]